MGAPCISAIHDNKIELHVQYTVTWFESEPCSGTLGFFMHLRNTWHQDTVTCLQTVTYFKSKPGSGKWELHASLQYMTQSMSSYH